MAANNGRLTVLIASLFLISCGLDDDPILEDSAIYAGCYSNSSFQMQLDYKSIYFEGFSYPYRVERRTVGPVIGTNLRFVSNDKGVITPTISKSNYNYRIILKDGVKTILITDNRNNVYHLEMGGQEC